MCYVFHVLCLPLSDRMPERVTRHGKRGLGWKVRMLRSSDVGAHSLDTAPIHGTPPVDIAEETPHLLVVRHIRQAKLEIPAIVLPALDAIASDRKAVRAGDALEPQAAARMPCLDRLDDPERRMIGRRCKMVPRKSSGHHLIELLVQVNEYFIAIFAAADDETFHSTPPQKNIGSPSRKANLI